MYHTTMLFAQILNRDFGYQVVKIEGTKVRGKIFQQVVRLYMDCTVMMHAV